MSRTALGGSGPPGQNDRRYGNPRAALRPWVPSTRTPRGQLSPEARSCAARGAAGRAGGRCSMLRGGVGGGCTPGHVPHPPRGGGVHAQGVPHHTMPHMARCTPRPWHTAPRKNGPLGSRGLAGRAGYREYTGIHGEYTGIREYTGIHGITWNTREYGNTRNTLEYTEYTGIREYTGIHGIHGNTALRALMVRYGPTGLNG